MASGIASPQSGRYLTRNRGAVLALRLADGVLDPLAPVLGGRRTPITFGETDSPRILLAVGGHLGDAVIASGAIRLVRRALPRARIGVATGSWSRIVLRDHPDVEWSHVVDHWKTNRASRPIAERWRRYRSSLRVAVAELRSVQYDAAVDLYPYFPNMSELLWRSRISVRVGWTSGGFGALYTHAVPWKLADDHVLRQHRALLSTIIPAVLDDPELSYDLPPVPADALRSARERLAERGVTGSYVVVHAGTGQREREWPFENWQRFCTTLHNLGHTVVLTGQGDHEAALASALVEAAPGTVNVVGVLKWQEFIAVVQGALMLYAVDTVAGHLAAAAGVPSAVLWTGATNPAHWAPLGTSTRVMMKPVPCAPCYRKLGCSTMACIRGVTVEDLIDIPPPPPHVRA